MIEVSFADPTAAAYVSDMYIVSEKYKLGDDYSSCYRFMKADVPDTPEEIIHSLMKGKNQHTGKQVVSGKTFWVHHGNMSWMQN